MEATRSVQVVSVEDDHSYLLCENNLEKILMREGIKDLPVAVVSVAGAYRCGKSFLLNFFLRYLSASPSARAEGTWLGEEHEPLSGFSWRGGSERNTTGILMCSDPLIVALPTGEKVAVLLMDTQGTFDSSSSTRDNSTIFALSTLLSSTQIYNLKSNITEEDLQNLELFTDYGKLMKEQSGKAFQVLEFLVRDWMNPWEYKYGEAGGETYLAKIMKISDDQQLELKKIRQHLLASFEKVTCFLMPHPGFGILDPAFKGSCKEMSKPFCVVLKELAASLFSPEKLIIKKHLSGEAMKAHELFSLFKSCMTVFNSEKIPTPANILQVTVESGLLLAMNQIRDEFEKNMTLACGLDTLSMPAEDVLAIHRKEISAARTAFKANKLLGDREYIDKKLEKLEEELNARQNEFMEINKAKTLKAIEMGNTAFDKVIENITNGKELCVHALDLQKIYDDAFVAARKVFSENRKMVYASQDPDREKFEKDLSAKYDLLRMTNDQNNKRNVNELKAEYFEYIISKTNNVPNLCGDSFVMEHKEAVARALKEFEERRNLPNSYEVDTYKANLIESMTIQYIQAKQINESASKELLQKVLAMYNQFMTITPTYLRSACVHPKTLKTEHEDAKRRAMEILAPNHLCDDAARLFRRTVDENYELLKEANEYANLRAVSRGYDAFKRKYDSLSNYWYWAFTSWDTADKYYREALEIGKSEFCNYRRHGYVASEDTYWDSLVDKCYNYYKSS